MFTILLIPVYTIHNFVSPYGIVLGCNWYRYNYISTYVLFVNMPCILLRLLNEFFYSYYFYLFLNLHSFCCQF